MPSGKDKHWKLIPLDLKFTILDPKCVQVRSIPLNSTQTLEDPRKKSVSIPAAPKIYFRWPDPVLQQTESNQSEYFEHKSPTYSWHTPCGDPYSISCGTSDNDKLLPKQDEEPQPDSDLEEGEIPESAYGKTAIIPGPMVKRLRAKWNNNNQI